LENDCQRFNALRESEKVTVFSPVEREKSAPVGITRQVFRAPQGRRCEDLAENPYKGLLARGSMPFQYFVDFKNQRESIDTVFPRV
jgi:hypothetical protein